MRKVFILPWLALWGVGVASAAPQVMSSATTQATTIELYTSEGCSSCPAADAWLSGLKDDSRLWHEIIPVAFHVDYWDYLGWKDRFAKSGFSARQQWYASRKHVRTVYTPGVMRNGREWRGWRFASLDSGQDKRIGVLRVETENGELSARFEPTQSPGTELVLNVAVLGFDLKTPVRAGENSGKVLKHDFVALAYQTAKGRQQQGIFQWSLHLPELQDGEQTRRGLAVWVSASDDPTPLQATGGWLAH